MSDYLDGIHDNTDVIYQVAEELHYLAVAFNRTGNDTVAQKLSLQSARLHAAQKGITAAVSKELTRQVKGAEETSHAMLRATLAGVELGKTEAGVGDVSDEER